MNKIKNNKFFPFIFIIILSVIICAPLFTLNLYEYNEARIHLARILAIDDVIKDGIFPPIINYKFMNGFGYALNLFYGPLTTYLPIIFLNIFGSAGVAFKVFTLLTVIFSGITMYNFVFEVTKRKSMALISALIYISALYKLSDIYFRDAIGEYTAFIFIPLVFQGLYNIIQNKKCKSFLLAIGIIGLVLSHTITTVYIALFSVIYLLFNIKKLKNFKVWKQIFINILLAFLVCAFYAIPLLEHTFNTEYALYSQEDMGTSGKYVQATGLKLKDLVSNELGNQEIRFSIGLVILVLVILSIFCYKKIDKNLQNEYIIFAILALISIFMSTKYFQWTIMPNVLSVIQFAWRNLGFFTFFISLVCGINGIIFAENILKKKWISETFLFGVVFSVFVFAFLGVFREWKFQDVSKEMQTDEKFINSERISPMQVNREYMPLKALNNLEYVISRENKTYVLEGNLEIVSENKDKLTDEIVVNNVQEGTIIEMPYLYYLGYDIQISYDGEEFISVKPKESLNGFLSLKLSQCSTATINLKYEGTLLEKISYIISIIGLALLGFYIIKEKKMKEKENESKVNK